jgi:hypothetical protein
VPHVRGPPARDPVPLAGSCLLAQSHPPHRQRKKAFDSTPHPTTRVPWLSLVKRSRFGPRKGERERGDRFAERWGEKRARARPAPSNRERLSRAGGRPSDPAGMAAGSRALSCEGTRSPAAMAPPRRVLPLLALLLLLRPAALVLANTEGACSRPVLVAPRPVSGRHGARVLPQTHSSFLLLPSPNRFAVLRPHRTLGTY